MPRTRIREWRYSSNILDLGLEGGGQIHAPAALPPGKEVQVPIGWEAGWVSETVWMLWSREEFLTPAGNRTPAIHPVSRLCTDWLIYIIHVCDLYVKIKEV
jgi:hypothetical protein